MNKREVAIAALSCRLPGIRGDAQLWSHLKEPSSRLAPLPVDRWAPRLHQSDCDAANLASITSGALLTDFSVDFRTLRIPPLQMERMHRMDLLAFGTICEALLDAGIREATTSVEDAQIVIAAQGMGPDPATDTVRRIRRFELQEPIREAMTDLPSDQRAEVDELVEQLFNMAAPPMEVDSLLTSSSIVAGRVANVFNFRGGHQVIDCGAASSIAALEVGFNAIARGEASIVVVAAFSPLLTASTLLRHAACGLLGHSKPFDPSSTGLELGEGCVAVVLRAASECTKPAYAIIDSVETIGCAATRDASALLQSLSAAALATGSPRRVRFVASRASGVPAWDAAERQALTESLLTDDAVLSSQASTLGHLQAASGLCAVAEAALACRYGEWPQTKQSFTAGELVAVSDAGMGSVTGVALLRQVSTTSHLTLQAKPSLEDMEDDVVIVGLGAIAPQAASATELWKNVLAKVEAIGDLPSTRFDADKLIGSGTEAASMLRTRLAGIAQAPALDWERLGTNLVAMASADPAVAYVLGVAVEALAAHDLSRYAPERVDVLFGQIPLRSNETLLEKRVLFAHHAGLVREALSELGWDHDRVNATMQKARASFERTAKRFDAWCFDSFGGSACATAVANAFGFRGLLASTDAACASGLAAVKIGIDRLRRGRSDMVIAGGVAYNILPEFYIALSMLGVLSNDAAPPFSRAANGFVPAEGAGCVVLKRKSDALRDGDRILAVIRGIGCSSDGRGQAVLSPNTEGQQLAIRRALTAANVRPSEIELLEAHGAGTRVGDEVEMRSYLATYGIAPRSTPLSVGALKSQIGHTSSASGILGLIKATLALDSKMIPPSNLEDDAREGLPFGAHGLELATTSRKWFSLPGKRRYAAASAIGMGGSNYHVVLERYETSTEVADSRPTLPPRGTYASRFVIDRVPLVLTDVAQRSLAGRHFLIIASQDAAPIRNALISRGALVTVLAWETSDIAASLETARARHGRFSGVVDLSSFVKDDGERASLALFGERLGTDNKRFFAFARALYDELQEDPAVFYCITALGADFGLLGGSEGSPFGASRQGFLRALKQETPSLDAKAFDMSIGESLDDIAHAVLAEIDDANDRVDVAYRGKQRFVPQFVRRVFAEDDATLRNFGKGDVAVITGGGRGVTFVCAKVLAGHGVRTIVCGRTKAPSGDEPWLTLDDAGFTTFKQEELVRRRKLTPSLTPAAFQREFSVVAAQRELHANLQTARTLGLDLHYVVCDVTDAHATAAMVRDVRAQHGPITAVIHGAMVETSRSVPSKTDEIVHATYATKATAMLNLWEATRSDPLRTFMCFGSGAGRFGNRGQSDYAGANALMAHLLAALGSSDPRMLHHVTLDWTAWEGTGAAVSDPALAALVKGTGVSSIRPEEGEYWFLSELFLGRGGESLIFDERLLASWPFMGSRADGAGARRRYTNSFGELTVPGEFPLIDSVDASNKLVERKLDMRRDVFIAQHRLFDTPILPATFGVELLGEAATVLSPGYFLQRIEEYAIHTPTKLHRGEPLTLQVALRVEHESATERVVLVESRSKLVVKGRTLQEMRLHHTARAILKTTPPPITACVIDEPTGLARARSFFHMAKDPVGLGPVFSSAAWIRVADQNVFGRVRAPRLRDLFAGTASPRFQTDPIVMDAAFQIAANWDGLRNDFVSIPFGVAAIEVGGTRSISEGVKVRATVVRVQDPDVYYDLVITSEQGDVLLTIRGLHLRRISKLSADQTRGAS